MEKLSYHVIAVTGHRPKGLYGYKETGELYEELRACVRLQLRSLYMDYGTNVVICGGAVGADMIVAEEVVRLQKGLCEGLQFPIKLWTAVPCWNQEKLWDSPTKKRYYALLSASDKVITVTEDQYSPDVMIRRNCWMVDHADAVFALWNGEERGGTWNTVSYAKSKHMPLFVLNPKDIEKEYLR